MAEINENRKKPVKKSKLQERNGSHAGDAEKMQELKNKTGKK